jgi:uncharacterized oxidoreductase
MSLGGRTILITGGTRGIGRAIAERLLPLAPGRIILVGRDSERLRALADVHPSLLPILCDLADPAAVDAFARQITREHPDLSVLVNNAGTQMLTDLMSPEAPGLVAPLRRELSLNLDGVIALTLGLMPVLLAQKRSIILNVTSGLALAPKQSAPVYCASKAGIRSFTKALRYQARTRAPHLSIVEALPPLVATGMTEGRGRGKISADECARAIVDGVLAGKETIYVGKAKLLRALLAVSPRLAERIMRDG